MPPDIETAREWMQFSHEDLRSAKRLIEQAPALLKTGCFHCQQTVEKALKAVLVLNGQRPPRTHSLPDLFGLSGRWLPDVLKHEAECTWLTTFAVETRYPDCGQPVTAEMAKQALSNARALFDLVCSNVPAEVRP